MEAAFRYRNISNRTEITHSFLQIRVNGRILRTVELVSTLNTACIAFGVYNAMEIEFKFRNINNRMDITHTFRQNRVNGRIFRADLYVSTLKLACIAFGILKAMETAFKRRNISKGRI